MKYSLVLLLFFSSCHYRPDKLTICNKTKSVFYFGTFAKLISDERYFPVSGGCEVLINSCGSPPTRSSIESQLVRNDVDANLYIVLLRVEDSEKFHANTNKSIESGKYKVLKFTKRELDEKNWKVVIQ